MEKENINMDDKNMRMNMIKLFGLGIKYANAGIVGDDFFYSNVFEDLFDDGDEPATVEQIIRRLENISCSHIEEKKKTSKISSMIRKNNEIIELLQEKIPELNKIGG